MLDRYHEHSERILSQIPKGVFITVGGKEKPNTMTIGWGHMGVIWTRPVFIAYVRYSRHTYDCLLAAEDFTINIPEEGTLKDALKIAGTQSGRDIDKFEEAKLTQRPSQKVQSPGIEQCPLNIECRIIYKQTMEPALVPEDVKARYYPHHDTHIMFFGEILEITDSKK